MALYLPLDGLLVPLDDGGGTGRDSAQGQNLADRVVNSYLQLPSPFPIEHVSSERFVGDAWLKSLPPPDAMIPFKHI